MATFNWTVSRLDCYPTSEGKTDMVFNVYWSCEGSQQVDSVTYTNMYTGATFIPYNPDHHWVEYADLTQAEVLEWVYEAGIDKALIESIVQTKIDQQIVPVVVSLPLPWVAPTP